MMKKGPALGLLLWIAQASGLGAQEYTGRVVAADGGEGVGNAFVELLGVDEERIAGVFADGSGRFRIAADGAEGPFTLAVGALGYGRRAWSVPETTGAGVLDLGTMELEEVPITLTPLDVQVQRSRLTPGREWIRQRQLLGKGTFFAGAMLAAANPRSLTDYLADRLGYWAMRDQWGTPRLVNPKSCMLLMLNEWPLNRAFDIDDLLRIEGYPSIDDIPIEAIAAIEVYDDMREVPAGRLWFSSGGAAHACGVINIWTWDSY